MKKIIATLALFMATLSPVQSATVYENGVLYGNICRAGLYYIVLPFAPVGTACYIDYAGVRWFGSITAE